jgi:hypothetical protein
MKLETSVPARRDGTVRATMLDGTLYIFTGDPLTCDIKDKAHIAYLLSRGDYFPYDASAIPEALAVVEAAQAGEDPEGEGEDQPDDEGNEEALPVEALTPPKRFKPKAKK